VRVKALFRPPGREIDHLISGVMREPGLGQCLAAHRQFAFQSQELTLLVPNNSEGGASGFKSGASFLEKCLSPLVKERLLHLVLGAHNAHRHTLNQMFSQDVHFLFRGEVASGSFHFGLHGEPTL
jgi:hypothetical protein